MGPCSQPGVGTPAASHRVSCASTSGRQAWYEGQRASLTAWADTPRGLWLPGSIHVVGGGHPGFSCFPFWVPTPATGRDKPQEMARSTYRCVYCRCRPCHAPPLCLVSPGTLSEPPLGQPSELGGIPILQRSKLRIRKVSQSTPGKAMADAGFQGPWAFPLETNIGGEMVWAGRPGVWFFLACSRWSWGAHAGSVLAAARSHTPCCSLRARGRVPPCVPLLRHPSFSLGPRQPAGGPCPLWV